jgi:hypothetical protein
MWVCSNRELVTGVWWIHKPVRMTLEAKYEQNSFQGLEPVLGAEMWFKWKRTLALFWCVGWGPQPSYCHFAVLLKKMSHPTSQDLISEFNRTFLQNSHQDRMLSCVIPRNLDVWIIQKWISRQWLLGNSFCDDGLLRLCLSHARWWSSLLTSVYIPRYKGYSHHRCKEQQHLLLCVIIGERRTENGERWRYVGVVQSQGRDRRGRTYDNNDCRNHALKHPATPPKPPGDWSFNGVFMAIPGVWWRL